MTQDQAIDVLTTAGVPPAKARTLVDCCAGMKAALAVFGPPLGRGFIHRLVDELVPGDE